MTTDTEQLQSLDDVLSGNEPAAQATDTTAQGSNQVDTGAQTDEAKGPDAAKAAEAKADPEAATAQTTGANAGEQKPKEEEWTKKAVLDERRKRQELERKLEELQKQQQPADKRPDLFADPEGALSHLETRLRQESAAARIELSQELMRSLHDDYDELEAEFHDLAKDNPVLLKQLAQATNPARFAYETAHKARQAAALNDVDKVRAELEAKHLAEIEARVRKEYEEKYGKEAVKRAAASAPSLAATTGKSSINDQPEESLDNILKDRKKR